MPACDIQSAGLSSRLGCEIFRWRTSKASLYPLRTYCTALGTWDHGGTTKIPAVMEPTIWQREEMINIHMGSKFYSRLDNKGFAKAEGQVTMWNRVSRASLHEKMWAEGRVGRPRDVRGRAGQAEGRKQSPEVGGERTQYPKACYFSLSNLDFICHRYFSAQNRDAVHVYWMTLKPVNTTMDQWTNSIPSTDWAS